VIRKAIVSGQFYPGTEKTLRKKVAELMPNARETINAIGVISPHAGYVYSGPVAGEVLSKIKPKKTYIILGPNHTGQGKPFGLDRDEDWETPLGKVEIDKDLADAILMNSEYVEKDNTSHDYEHSIEVQIPFLQHANRDFKIVPIVVAASQAKVYKTIGKEIASAVRTMKKEVTIIASSDMTHYESHESAEKKDKAAIEKILALDIDGFLATIEKYKISMCGYAPTAIMMAAAIELGAKKAELVKYNTSGDTSGDYSAVVGYAGILIN